MKVNTYDIGDLVKISAVFTDPDTGDPVDPESVTCTVLSGAKKTSTPSVLKDAPGEYSAQVKATGAGDWHFAFDGKGGHVASQEGKFKVRQQLVPR